MKKFENKTVMITGAGGGIGYAVMKQFAAQGADVIACEYKETETFTDKWDSVAAEFGCKVYPIFFDLGDEEAIKAGLKDISALKVQIDVLVNCAGIAKFGPVIMTSQSMLKQIFQVNYFAQVQITQYIAKLMLRAKKGAIINLASIAGMEATPGNCAYGASKASVVSFTRVAAQELYSFGIRVNAVAPGFISTPMQQNVDKATPEKEMQRQAIKPYGEPEELAQVIAFLASDDASYVTGQIIRLDGGM